MSRGSAKQSQRFHEPREVTTATGAVQVRQPRINDKRIDEARGERQRRLLEAEGVPFRGDRVDMRAARLPDLL